jgi:DNA/RNA endonuclease G (NUC1)
MQKILKVILAVGLLAMAGSSPALSKAECNPADKIVANCSAIWKAIGLPDYTTTPSNKIAVCHDRYVLSHDNASKTPDWVVEVLNKAKLTNKFPRPKIKFSGDLCIPPEGQPDPGDYAKTADKFEIGHQAPSEDFNNSDVNMRDTFVFSNAVPQGGDTFNAGIWKTLETEVRKAAVARQTIYVITGPVRGSGGKRSISIAKADNACGGALDLEAFKTAMVCKAVNQKKATSCSSGVVVPVALYKIVYDPKKNAAYAFLMANRNYKTGLGRPFLEESRVNVGVIEKLTGLKFFSALPADKRASLIDKCEPTQLWAAATSAKKKKKPQ